jgi:glyoxylase-like metal-dependent hydrolase (beta-lactamase superfamily II)
MHPRYEHGAAPASDPAAALERRLEIGRQSGVPESTLRRYVATRRAGSSGIAQVRPPDRELVDGVTVDTDLGVWRVYETPGHAPSHVCLYQPQRRLLISGDHVLGRVSLYYDFGWTPDPVGEYLASLDVVDPLDARLGLSGHGKPFVDVPGHIAGARALAHERLAAVREAVAQGPVNAVEIAPAVHDGEPLSESNAPWLLAETLCYLHHLEREGSVRREEQERWVAAK